MKRLMKLASITILLTGYAMCSQGCEAPDNRRIYDPDYRSTTVVREIYRSPYSNRRVYSVE